MNKADDEPQDLSSETVADWYSYFREVTLPTISDRFQQVGPIGRVGHVVEIDNEYRKHHRERLVDGHWIIGMIDRQTSEIRVEICPNIRRDATTLIPIIQQQSRLAQQSILKNGEATTYSSTTGIFMRQ